MMKITAEAKIIIDSIVDKGKYFRVALEGGGCSGFKYIFDMDEKQEEDILIDNVVVDPISHQFLLDGVLHYKKEIFSQGFVIENPNVSATCGCGLSVNF